MTAPAWLAALAGWSGRALAALLPLSLAGAAVALAVGLTSRLLRGVGAPRAVAAALWLAVLVRLVCPVGVAVPVPATLQTAAQQAGDLAARTGATLTGTLDAALAGLTDAPAATAPYDPAAPDAALQGGSAEAQPAPGLLSLPQGAASGAAQPETPLAPAALGGQQLAGLVWLTGVLVLLARAGWQTARLHRRVRFACRAAAPDGTVYYQDAGLPTPFLLGLARPRIYLPAGLGDEARAAVLAHEVAHLRRGDHLLRPAFYLAACLHWANPLVWWAFRAFCRDTEAACDEAVLRTLGEAAKPGYCRTLLAFAQVRGVGPAAVAFAPDGLPARVRAILRWQPPRRWLSVLSAVAAAAVFTACMAQPAAPAASQPETLTVGGASSAAELQTGDGDTPAGSETDSAASSDAASDARSEPAGGAYREDPAASDADAPTDAAQDAASSAPYYQNSPAFAPYPSAPADGSWQTAPDLTALAWTWPVSDYTAVSAVYGTSQTTGRTHSGMDLAAAKGAAVLAAADGTVTAAGYDAAGDGTGNSLVIDHGGGVQTVYAHCDALTVAAGDAVTAGQTVAAVGSTGRSTGVHLHWELRVNGEPCDPALVFPAYAAAFPQG